MRPKNQFELSDVIKDATEEAFDLGKRSVQDDRRFTAACHALQGLIMSKTWGSESPAIAVDLADKLILELSKPKQELK